jgi:hypothetical protein
VLPPGSQIGPISPEQRQALLAGSLVAGVYEKTLDRESAYEVLMAHAGRSAPAEEAPSDAPKTPRVPGAAQAPAADNTGAGGALNELLFGRTGPRGAQHDGLVQTMAKTAARSVASGIGRQIVRGVLGSLLGGGRKR